MVENRKRVADVPPHVVEKNRILSPRGEMFSLKLTTPVPTLEVDEASSDTEPEDANDEASLGKIVRTRWTKAEETVLREEFVTRLTRSPSRFKLLFEVRKWHEKNPNALPGRETSAIAQKLWMILREPTTTTNGDNSSTPGIPYSRSPKKKRGTMQI